MAPCEAEQQQQSFESRRAPDKLEFRPPYTAIACLEFVFENGCLSYTAHYESAGTISRIKYLVSRGRTVHVTDVKNCCQVGLGTHTSDFVHRQQLSEMLERLFFLNGGYVSKTLDCVRV
jgi:hypothetical protein